MHSVGLQVELGCAEFPVEVDSAFKYSRKPVLGEKNRRSFTEPRTCSPSSPLPPHPGNGKPVSEYPGVWMVLYRQPVLEGRLGGIDALLLHCVQFPTNTA